MRARVTAAATACALLATAGHGDARVASDRTIAVSAGAGGSSVHPAISADGRFVAFASTATDLIAHDGNGQVRDIFVTDLETNTTRLVSRAHDGGPANGFSSRPAISADGSTIVFTSSASNLVPNDRNAQEDVFAVGAAGTTRVSARAGAPEPDGASGEPDVSADGRTVAFSSRATNLVPQDLNAERDVFVRDLVSGRVDRVSTPRFSGERGASRAPSISGDGRHVAFASSAAGLVPIDDNRIPDVFVADLVRGRLERVSVSTRGRAQNRSVAAPFVQISDISHDGRYVAFDSDATNLVAGDTNRDTDVFVRDRRERRTTRISVAASGAQADNDSFNPAMSADGRFVAFESFAGNLFPGDARNEDVFLHDRALRATTLLNVGRSGRASPELVSQLLQRPAVSRDGSHVAFVSSAPLLPGDRNRAKDVFARDTRPPTTTHASARSLGRRRVRYRLRADDPGASVFLCRLDWGRPRLCSRSGVLRQVRRGPHTLRVRAGGPGMRFERRATVVRFRVRR